MPSFSPAFSRQPARFSGQAQVPAFIAGCELPFKDLATETTISVSCAIDGVGSAQSRLQNRAKNNFCASGPAANITNTSFRNLQKKVDKLPASFQWGTPTNLPSDRSPLEDIYTTSNGDTIGEGALLRYVVFLMHAKHSNTSGGEKVNCDNDGPENNDVHLYLSRVKNEADDCNSVTAEISPHSRPATWNDLAALHSTAATHAWTKIQQANLARPLRFTGHLMFDAAHQPCRPGHAASPGRFSAWEIHPVYGIDVCSLTSWASCPVDDETVWTPLNVWMTQHP